MTEQPVRSNPPRHTYDNPRVILPTDYPDQHRPSTPYAGYKPPEGSPWYQNLHREIATPEGGGYLKNKYTFDYNGKTYELPLDANLPVDVAFPKLSEQLRYGINYNQSTPANSRLYWSQPQRVARVKSLLDTMPEGEELPDWLEPEKINTLYNYLEFLNPNKPVEEWAPLTEDDPAYSMLYSIKQPPQDLLSPYERDPVYAANSFLQNYQERYSSQNTEQAIRTFMENRGFTYEEANALVEEEQKVDFSKLEPAQKFLLGLQSMVPQDSNLPDWLKDMSAISGGVKAGMGGLGATAAIVGGTAWITSNIASTAAIGSALGPAGVFIGGVAAVGLGLATYSAIKRGDELTATKLLQVWNKPAEWAERLFSIEETQKQLRELGVDPSEYKLKDLMEAGRGFYESELYGIGNTEANLFFSLAHSLNPEWSSGLQATNGQVWQFQKGIVEPQAIKEGWLVGQPLAESVLRISSGEDEEAVYWDMVDRYGYSGTRADFHAQNWIDPLQYVPFMTSLFGEMIFGKLKMPRLAYSFAEGKGNILMDALPGNIQMPLSFVFNQRNRLAGKYGWGGTWSLGTSRGLIDNLTAYKISAQNMSYIDSLPISAYSVKNMSTFEKFLAGIDPKTNMILGEQLELNDQGMLISKRGSKLLSRTPENIIGRHLTNLSSAFDYINAKSSDPAEYMKRIDYLIDGSKIVEDNPTDPTVYAYDSPKINSIRSSLNYARNTDQIKTMMTQWEQSKYQRAMLTEIGEAIGINRNDVLAKLREGNYEEIIQSLKASTATSKIVDDVKTNKTTAEALKKIMKRFIKSNTPVEPALMITKINDALIDITAKRVSTAYGLDQNANKLWKWVAINKGVQSVAFLNNPTFLVKNLLNNAVTMSYDGIGSLFNKRTNDAVMLRYGITPPKEVQIGFNPIATIDGQPNMSSFLADNILKGMGTVRNLAVFTKWSSNIEGSAKYTAYTNAYIQAFDQFYKKALPSMPPEVSDALIRNGFDPKELETIVRGIKKGEQFNEGPDTVTVSAIAIDGAFEKAAADLDINLDVLKDLDLKLSITNGAISYMENAGMKPAEALRRVYYDIAQKAKDNYAKETADAYALASQDLDISGFGAAVTILDELTIGSRLQALDSAEKLHEITMETSRIRADNKGEEGRRMANNYYNAMQEDLILENSLKNRERSDSTLAVVHRLNPNSPDEAALADLLLVRNDLLSDSQQEVIDINNKYWDPDDESPLPYNEVQVMARAKQKEYAEMIARMDEEIEKYLLKIIGLDPTKDKTAQKWLDNSIAMRKELAELSEEAFKYLDDKDEPTRRRAWQKALDKKNKIVAKYKAASLVTADELNKVLRHNPNPPMYQPEAQYPDTGVLYDISYSGKKAYLGRDKKRDIFNLDSPLKYNENPIDLQYNKPLAELTAINQKYMGTWMNDNADELKIVRNTIQEQYSLDEQTAQFVMAQLAYKAEDNAFRTGTVDPMNYIRRYKFETTSEGSMLAEAQMFGRSSAGTSDVRWDVENAKWVIRAVKGKADIQSLLHELTHTFIFDLDRGDMIALNEVFKYSSVEELYNAHRGWLTARNNAGEEFSMAEYSRYADQSEAFVKLATEYFFKKNQRNGMVYSGSTFSKGLKGLLDRFRSYVVNIMTKYRQGWSGQQKGRHQMWTAETMISKNVEMALNRMYTGYSKDKVYIPDRLVLSRTPVSATYLGDIFGMNPDYTVDGYPMYKITPAEAAKYKELYEARQTEFEVNKLNVQLADKVLELPLDLENYIPLEYATATKKVFGDPGPVPGFDSALESVTNLDDYLFQIRPDIIDISENIRVTFSPEEAKALVVRDPDGTLFKKLTEEGITAREVNRLLEVDALKTKTFAEVETGRKFQQNLSAYEQALAKGKVPKKLQQWYQKNVIETPKPTKVDFVSSDIGTAFRKRRYEILYKEYLADNKRPIDQAKLNARLDQVIYWNSFRNSGLYGYSIEELATLRKNYVNKGGTITDPDIINARGAEFDKIAELSTLITKSAKLYDQILNKPIPELRQPNSIDFEKEYSLVETTYYHTLRQRECAKAMKKGLEIHNKTISFNGNSYYPMWNLPEPYKEALGLIKYEPVVKGTEPTTSRPVLTEEGRLDQLMSENPNTASNNAYETQIAWFERQTPRVPFPDYRSANVSDYLGSKMNEWPAEDVILVKNTLKGWLEEPDGPIDLFDKEATKVLTFTEHLSDIKATKDIPGPAIDYAMRAILLGEYKPEDAIQRKVLSGIVGKLSIEGDANSIALRTGLYGKLEKQIEYLTKNHLEPLQQADQYEFDARMIPVNRYKAQQALLLENQKKFRKDIRALEAEINRSLTIDNKYDSAQYLGSKEADILLSKLNNIKKEQLRILENYYDAVINRASRYTDNDTPPRNNTTEDLISGEFRKMEESSIDYRGTEAQLDETAMALGLSENLSEISDEGARIRNDQYQTNDTIQAINDLIINKQYDEAYRLWERLAGKGNAYLEDVKVDPELKQWLVTMFESEYLHPKSVLPLKDLPYDAQILRRAEATRQLRRDMKALEDWPTTEAKDLEIQQLDLAKRAELLAQEEVTNKAKIDEINKQIKRQTVLGALEVDEPERIQWDPIEASKTDPIVAKDLETEKEFMNAYTRETFEKPNIRSKNSYLEMKATIYYKMAEVYAEWNLNHPDSRASINNSDFAIELQRRVFPTLFNKNKKDSIYDLSLYERKRLYATPPQDLRRLGMFEILEFNRTAGEAEQINPKSLAKNLTLSNTVSPFDEAISDTIYYMAYWGIDDYKISEANNNPLRDGVIEGIISKTLGTEDPELLTLAKKELSNLLKTAEGKAQLKSLHDLMDKTANELMDSNDQVMSAYLGLDQEDMSPVIRRMTKGLDVPNITERIRSSHTYRRPNDLMGIPFKNPDYLHDADGGILGIGSTTNRFRTTNLDASEAITYIPPKPSTIEDRINNINYFYRAVEYRGMEAVYAFFGEMDILLKEHPENLSLLKKNLEEGAWQDYSDHKKWVEDQKRTRQSPPLWQPDDDMVPIEWHPIIINRQAYAEEFTDKFYQALDNNAKLDLKAMRDIAQDIAERVINNLVNAGLDANFENVFDIMNRTLFNHKVVTNFDVDAEKKFITTAIKHALEKTEATKIASTTTPAPTPAPAPIPTQPEAVVNTPPTQTIPAQPPAAGTTPPPNRKGKKNKPVDNTVPMGPANSISVSSAAFTPGKIAMDMLPNIKNVIEHTIGNLKNIDAKAFAKYSENFTPDQKKAFNEYLRQSQSALASSKQYANDYAVMKADTALLNYNDRTGMDNYLDLIFPYQFWFTRSLINWAKRMVNKPAILSQYANRVKHMERMGKEMKNMPLRLQGKMPIPFPFAEDWMGDTVYTNPWQDLMPVNQLLAPLEYLAESNYLDPESELYGMLNEKEITQEEYDEAVANRSGEYWDQAMELAKAKQKSDRNPMELASMLLSPNWLLTELDSKIRGVPKPNAPMTNTGYGLQSHGQNLVDNGYELVGTALKKVGEAYVWPEKEVFKGERFIAYGKFGEYLILRELSNMAAEGKDTNAIIQTMIEKKGDLWIEANQRVMQQISLKTPTSLFVKAAEDGDLTSLPLAMVLTLFPAGIFPEGELEQLGLKEEFQSSWGKAGEGDATDLAQWFTDHPEYLARSAINDSPRLMLKKFLVNQIMEYYTGQDPKNKALFKEHLGEEFINKILAGGPVDYNGLELDELTAWARMAKGTVPDVTDTAGLTKALPDDQLPMQLDEEGLQVIDLYFNQRKELFPNQSWQNKAYHQLATQKEKSVYLAKYPELKQYWEWNNIYKKQNPVLKQWLERNDKFEGSEQQDPYYGIDPAIIEGYRAEKAQKFPNSQWLNAQYYAIPADQYDARKAFIKQYPELEAYWAWKKDIESRSPQIKYYNAEMDAAYEANNAFPVAPSDMAPNKIAEALDSLGILPYVQQDLIAYYVQGKPIPYGSLSYMKDMWEKEGSPDTLMEYIDNLF